MLESIVEPRLMGVRVRVGISVTLVIALNMFKVVAGVDVPLHLGVVRVLLAHGHSFVD